MKILKKAYYLFFYKILKAIHYSNKSYYIQYELKDMLWRATGILMILITALVFALNNILEIIMQHAFLSDLSIIPYIVVIIIVGIFIYMFIYYTLIYENRWASYMKEFEKYSRTKNVFINICVILVVLSILGITALTYIIWGDRFDAGSIL